MITQGYTGYLSLNRQKPEEVRTQLSAELRQLANAGVRKISCWLAEHSQEMLPELQAACRSLNIQLVGALFPAVIYQGKLKAQGCLIKALPDTLQSRLISCENQSPEDIAEAFNGLNIQAEAQPNLFLIFDALQPNISAILDQLYLKLHNSVRYCGTNAGSETFQPMACLFDENTRLGYGLWALLFNTDYDHALAHGYQDFDPVTATSTTGNRIHSIDWQNAFEVYQREVEKQLGKTVTTDNFYDVAPHFPFGIIRLSGQPLVRIPVAVEDDGTLVCVGDIPEHTVISLLQGVKPDGDETLSQLSQQINKQAPDYQVFYCAGRRMHLGEKTEAELSNLKQRLHHREISGALSLGEICNDNGQGYPLFHNAAIVCCPWL